MLVKKISYLYCMRSYVVQIQVASRMKSTRENQVEEDMMKKQERGGEKNRNDDKN